jgi:tripartite-type tricarboxylate transporter receptor subunit TctC
VIPDSVKPKGSAMKASVASALGILSLVLATGMTPARADEPVDFKGETVTLLVGFAAGGGTDATARLMAPFFGKYLPGHPTVIVRNMPGAFGMTSLNYILQQTKPDGLTLSLGANSQVDPVNYRKAPIHYDPRDFVYIGGIGRGGSALLANEEAVPRLSDKKAAPVVMGSVGSWPRGGMQTTVWGIEFLGWNARWVSGYQGNNDLILALDRGEVDMTSTSNKFQIDKLVASGRFRILYQNGSLENGRFVGRPDLPGVPVFEEVMRDKIADPLAEKAFQYWVAITATDKFLALAPKTPAPISAAYRTAFLSTVKDPEFVKLGPKLSEDFAAISAEDIARLIGTLADTPDEVVTYMTQLLAKQGLEDGGKKR